MIVLCANSVAVADTFYINPEESYLSIAVLDHSSSYQLTSAQFSGSDVTSLGGSFDATIGGGTITFTTSSNIIFNDLESDVYPDIGGGSDSAGDSLDPYPPSPGSGAGNYGLVLTVPNDPEDLGEGLALAGFAAIRSAIADATSSAITITAGEFDASGITLDLADGDLDYNINLGDGTPFIHGTTGIDANGAVNSATEGVVGTFEGQTFVSFPVDVSVHVTTSGLDVDVVLQGFILGITAPESFARVPEPTTWALMAVGLVGLLPWARRMRGK